MKIYFIVIVAIIFIFSYPYQIQSQQIIKNSEIQKNETAGREKKLKEVLRIKDSGEKFFLRYPSKVKVAPDGTIFIKDWKQLYQLDKNGKFVRNYYKKGKGPGEFTYPGNFLFFENKVYVKNTNPYKIAIFNLDGTFIREIKIESSNFINLEYFNRDNYYFTSSAFPRTKMNTGFVDVPKHVLSYNQESKRFQKIATFTVKSYVKKGKQGGAASVSVNRFLIIPFNNKYLAVSLL